MQRYFKALADANNNKVSKEKAEKVTKSDRKNYLVLEGLENND